MESEDRKFIFILGVVTMMNIIALVSSISIPCLISEKKKYRERIKNKTNRSIWGRNEL